VIILTIVNKQILLGNFAVALVFMTVIKYVSKALLMDMILTVNKDIARNTFMYVLSMDACVLMDIY
jgi:hypothetical protein